MDLFEIASRKRYRFDTAIGALTAEDLWSLPLTSKTRTNLDDIAIDLYKQANVEATTSFVLETPTDTTQEAKDKFAIVKHIIDVRLEENKAAATAASNREKKAQILAIIQQKQNEQLAGSSLEELIAAANAL